MTAVTTERTTQMRAQRTASLQHTCRISARLPGQTYAEPVEVACTVKLSSGSIRGGFGSRIGYGGGAPPMDRHDDVSISFPYGTAIATGDKAVWVEGGVTYEIGQKRRAKGFDFDVTVQAVEVPS